MNKFQKQATALIQEHGGEHVEDDRWEMWTKFGPLTLHVWEDAVMTRFEFPKVAFPRTGCNRYSGKWNFHYSGNEVETAINDFSFHLDKVEAKSVDKFVDATSLVPDVISDTVIQESEADFQDPPYMGDRGLSHEDAKVWLGLHCTQRLIFLYENNSRIREQLESDSGRDVAYAFVEHWLMAYLDSPPKYRERKPIL